MSHANLENFQPLIELHNLVALMLDQLALAILSEEVDVKRSVVANEL